MSDEEKATLPRGCPGCNSEEVIPILRARGIKVEEVPPGAAWQDVILCDACGRAWLMIPRPGDPGTPVA